MFLITYFYPTIIINLNVGHILGFSLFVLFADRMRTWVIGDSIVARAGKNNIQLRGGGVVIWQGVGGAKCAGLVNRLTRLLRREPFPTTVILHLGTNDIFKSSTWEINKRVRENLEGIRRLLPNTRMIWSDIIIRLEYADERVARAGKDNMRNINKRAHSFLRKLDGDNKVVVHSGIFQSGRHHLDNHALFEYDCTHPTDWGLHCFRENLSNALIYFNQNPASFEYPPGSIRLQNQH